MSPNNFKPLSCRKKITGNFWEFSPLKFCTKIFFPTAMICKVATLIKSGHISACHAFSRVFIGRMGFRGSAFWSRRILSPDFLWFFFWGGGRCVEKSSRKTHGKIIFNIYTTQSPMILAPTDAVLLLWGFVTQFCRYSTPPPPVVIPHRHRPDCQL